MNKFRLILNKFVKAKFFLGLLIVGIVFCFGGVLAMNATSSTSEKAEGTIVSIYTGDYDSETGTYPDCVVTVSYEDSEGNTHVATMNAYNSSWSQGDTISIQYDPTDYDSISTGLFNLDIKTIGIIILALGAVCIIASIVKIVLIATKSVDDDNEFNKVDMKNVSSEKIQEVKDNNEEDKGYYFYFTEGFKPNYIMDTQAERKVVYEAQNQALGLVTSYKFNFVNHLTGKQELKTCSHTVSTEYGEGSNLAFNTTASFKIDGKECWKVLGEMGYSIEPSLKDLHATFDVMKYGVHVATFEQTGTNVMTGKDYKLGNVPSKGIYKITCKESDIEGVFYCCFVVARTFDL